MSKLLKYPAYFLLALVALFIAFLAIATLSDFNPGETVPCEVQTTASDPFPDDSVFSITTWNIGYFGLGKECDFFFDGGKMTRPDPDYYRFCTDMALDYLKRKVKTDFYFFQEADLDSRRSYDDAQPAMLAQQLPGFEYAVAVNYKVFFVPVPVKNPMGRVNSGIVTFSVFPAVECTRYAFPGGYGWPVKLFQLDRCFLLTRIRLQSGRDLVLINTHNEAFDDGSQRKQQMDVLKQTMFREYELGNYVVTGGDWNLNPVGFATESLSEGYPGHYIEPLIEPGFLPGDWTWAFDPRIPTNRYVDQPYRKGTTPVTTIDFFVVSPNIHVDYVLVEDLGFQWSDHHPVTMQFRLD